MISIALGLGWGIASPFSVTLLLSLIPVLIGYLSLRLIKGDKTRIVYAVLASLLFGLTCVLYYYAPGSDSLGAIALITLPFVVSVILLILLVLGLIAIDLSKMFADNK